MERIREFVLGASYPTHQYLWSYIVAHTKEIKSYSFILLVFLVAVGLAKHNEKITSLYNIKVSSPTGLELTDASKNYRKKFVINVEELISKATPYSYSETQLGFYLKDFKFFSSNSKLKVEKRILASLPKGLSQNARRYVKAVLRISEKHQVDPIWVLSVMWTESHFDFKAISHAGAKGLMQIMPTTKKYIYKRYIAGGNKLVVEKENFDINNYFPYDVNLLERQTHISKLINIELGIIYLKSLLKYFDKNHTHATVAYNMGPTWTRGRLNNNLPVGKRNDYLNKVQKAYRRLVKKI